MAVVKETDLKSLEFCEIYNLADNRTNTQTNTLNFNLIAQSNTHITNNSINGFVYAFVCYPNSKKTTINKPFVYYIGRSKGIKHLGTSNMPTRFIPYQNGNSDLIDTDNKVLLSTLYFLKHYDVNIKVLIKYTINNSNYDDCEKFESILLGELNKQGTKSCTDRYQMPSMNYFLWQDRHTLNCYSDYMGKLEHANYESIEKECASQIHKTTKNCVNKLEIDINAKSVKANPTFTKSLFPTCYQLQNRDELNLANICSKGGSLAIIGDIASSI